MIGQLLKYLSQHWIYGGLAAYFVISVVLHMSFDIHILIPCIWKMLSGYSCPGCGLTTAFIAMIQLKWAQAWAANPLIFLLVPATILLVVRDFKRYT